MGDATRSWNGPPPKMAAPLLPLLVGRHRANCLATLSADATCDDSDRGSLDSGNSGFLPSVAFAACLPGSCCRQLKLDAPVGSSSPPLVTRAMGPREQRGFLLLAVEISCCRRQEEE
ncbi:hypothetical protein SETIT_5G340500v2 [Setaria italica]|uniref:Uncharacterized protein n=1 Tax=Setaria italica TaxID=4555 RepID=A0A368RBZ7_SETIT|nr:hypothetical protein SETIT_5G340500v2 [Setaria italica]